VSETVEMKRHAMRVSMYWFTVNWRNRCRVATTGDAATGPNTVPKLELSVR
jgi:hypothetical protein